MAAASPQTEIVDLLASRRQRPGRQRRTPDEARAEILSAAHRFLDERPFREMNVDTLMQRSALGRSSFYVYFRDRYEVVQALIAGILKEVDLFAETWISGDQGTEDIKYALMKVQQLYRQHGRVLKALSDGASNDVELETIHSKLVAMLIEATRKGIVRAQQTGKSIATNADDVARALVLMTERLANDAWGTAQRNAKNDRTLDALIHVWCWSIYGKSTDPMNNNDRVET